MVSKHKKRMFSGIGFSRFLMTGLFVLSSFSAFSQFTIVENFKGSGHPDVNMGDRAYFTFAGKLNLTTNSTGIVATKRMLKRIPEGNVLLNGTSYATDIVDRVGNNVDLVINATVDPSCVDANAGNYHKLVVTNIGGVAATYGGETIVRPGSNLGLQGIYNRNRIEVIVVVPNTYNLSDSSHSGWQSTEASNTPTVGFTTYTYLSNFTSVTPITGNTAPPVANAMLNPGMTMPPIIFNIKNYAGQNVNYALSSKVRWILESGAATKPNSLPTTVWAYAPVPERTSLEATENEGNSTTNISMLVRPAAPVTTATLYYCQNEAGKPLAATATGTNTLVWYLAQDGVPSNSAITPNTTVAGTISYWVSQSNGTCESRMSKIDVVVMKEPTPGTISTTSPFVCRGAGLTTITNGIGTGAPGSIITYRWEKSEDGGTSWSAVPYQTERTYFPVNMQRTTSYRRITIATLGGKSCESVPTIPMVVKVRNCTVISNPMLPSKAKIN